ncbi:hypothetical protein [Rhodococcus koreensis]|uniref:hypothetical protein n=1 Tax=Rhodococcus koreensis TaxID=99653 RepID=UPI00197F28A8|nr:hypothetical protein [Rhodococcus koreensis]QSE86926.1 hypothetical protein JWS14_48865 [Rhodococcus koreensis]
MPLPVFAPHNCTTPDPPTAQASTVILLLHGLTAVFRLIAGAYAPRRSFEHWSAMNSANPVDH